MASIATWTPFRQLDAIERRIRRMLEDIGFVSARLPAADVYQTAEEFVVELEVPGYEENELSIEISDHTLTVTGERMETRDEMGKEFRLRERLEHKFERRYELPREADTEHVRAVFEKGVLKVRGPKREKVTPRKVEISKPGRAERGT